MRIPTMLTLDPDTVNQLRQKAIELGVPYSALANQILRVGLHVFVDKLPKWAQSARRAPGAGRNLAAREPPSHVVMRAALPVEWTDFKEMRLRSGQPLHVAWNALIALRARGLAEGEWGRDPVKDPRGRPIHSRWRRKP